MQNDGIIEKAKKLGLNVGDGSNNLDNLYTIANQIGIRDIHNLESALDERLSEIEPMEVDNLYDGNVERLEDNYDIPNKEENSKPRFGEQEYKNATDKNGAYDKNYYANRGKELDEKVQKAKEEKNTDLKNKDKKDTTPVKPNGENTVKKNKWDKAKDNINLMKAKNERFQNRLDNAKAKAYQVMHPGETLKNKTKDAVKNTAKNVGKKTGKAAAKAGKAATKATITGVKTAVTFLLANPLVLLLLGVLIFIFLIIILFFGGPAGGESAGYGLYGYDYVEPKCTEITIDGGEYAGVYDIEEYVAGVTFGEFGIFASSETRREAAKAGAIAARSFVLANINDTCTVVSSESFQVYKTPDEKAIEVANETRGLVLTNNSNRIISTMYDAFCTAVPQNDPLNYLVCQQNQLIPREWVDNQSGIKEDWKSGNKVGAHGEGMSAWGAAYLSEEKNQDYTDIIDYYYGNYELKSIYKSIGSYGEYPIDPNNEVYQNLAFLTNESLNDYLYNHGNSLMEFNNYLRLNIEKAGIGTREGVVNAAVTLIGTLAEMGIKINYQWGGKYENIGVKSTWGIPASTAICDNYEERGYDKAICTTNYQWSGLDCSGFVTWAIINGMQDNTITQSDTSSGAEIKLEPNQAVCKPGGVLINPGSHIVLVIGHDDINKRYIVAEATGSRINDGTGGVKFSYYDYDKKDYHCKNLENIYGD